MDNTEALEILTAQGDKLAPQLLWICRESTTGRGLRLHQSSIGRFNTAQEALKDWAEKQKAK